MLLLILLLLLMLLLMIPVLLLPLLNTVTNLVAVTFLVAATDVL